MKHDKGSYPSHLSGAINSISSVLQPSHKTRTAPITVAFLTFASALLAFQFFAFIRRYASDLLFSDQWYFYRPLILHDNIWQVFSWQHGPHRQGVGLLVTQLLAEWTHFDARADAFAVGAVLFLALVAALFVKARLFGRFTPYDIALPFLFLSLFQFEALVLVPNLSHGAFPVLLIMLYILSALNKNPLLRYTLLLILNFILIYTGFGVFMGIITLGLFAMEVYQNYDRNLPITAPLIAFGIAVISALSFFIDYRFFETAASCSSLEFKYIPLYPVFMSLSLAIPLGWHLRWIGWPAFAMGGTLLVYSGIVLIVCSRRLLQSGIYKDRIHLAIMILLSYSLLFCLNAAFGRTCLGLNVAQVSRYIPLLIPAHLAFYFYLLTLKFTGRWRFGVLSIYVILLSAGSLPVGFVDKAMLPFYNAKANWKACYLQYASVGRCNELTGFQPHWDANILETELSYFRTQKLNIFVSPSK